MKYRLLPAKLTHRAIMSDVFHAQPPCSILVSLSPRVTSEL
jgi:hypothetical protein